MMNYAQHTKPLMSFSQVHMSCCQAVPSFLSSAAPYRNSDHRLAKRVGISTVMVWHLKTIPMSSSQICSIDHFVVRQEPLVATSMTTKDRIFGTLMPVVCSTF